jgi:hypothetical protein
LLCKGSFELFYVILKSVCDAVFLFSAGIFVLCGLADELPVPLTPDYGEPVVSYADGVLDARFNRFVCVREGKQSRISLS